MKMLRSFQTLTAWSFILDVGDVWSNLSNVVDQGCISAPANLNSGDIARVIELCHIAEWEEAEKLHD